MRRIILFLFVAGVALFTFNSCKKITQDQLINGLWKVNTVTIDTSSYNYLNTLRHYPDGNECCAYKLDFEKDNVVIAYYIAYNDIEKIVAGSWEAVDYNTVTVQVDSFMDGNFEIARPSPKHWKLTGEKNHLPIFDGVNPALDTAETFIDMQKI